MTLLNLADLPSDPIEQIMWLTGVQDQVTKELDTAYRNAYFEARLQHRLESAISAGPHARKKVLAYTRQENEKRGRTVRWGDKADPTSTAFYKQ